MKSYVPHTEAERREMLELLNLKDMEALIQGVPETVRLKTPLDLPPGVSDMELLREMHDLSARNHTGPGFTGAGAYAHFIPPVVRHVLAKSAFYTAYTPYQPEISQGLLQAIFEYQTMICDLTGMDVSNASVYDGATACAEAMLLCRGAKRRNKVLYSAALNFETQRVLRTYADAAGIELCRVPAREGLTDLEALTAMLPDAAGFIAAQPNYYGLVEDIAAMSARVHQSGALMVACVNPIVLGLLKSPGECGADCVVGDGQPLGNPMGFGGPSLGFMAVKEAYKRNLPGRIVGQTVDAQGRRAFVLTLQAREQHIRREKAASNICSNQALNALAAAVYLATMGPEGLKAVAELCLHNAHYLCEGILRIPGMCRAHSAPFFHEFLIESDKGAMDIQDALTKRGVVGGYPLCRSNPDAAGILYCATELNTRAQMDTFLNLLEEVARP